MMKFVLSISNSIQNLFSKESKIDGRFLVLAVLLVYFGLVIISIFSSGHYPGLWVKLGVPTMKLPFLDLFDVLHGFDCMRANNNVFSNANTCFFGYPSTWQTLSGLGLGVKDILPLAGLSIIFFYLSTFLLIGRLNYWTGIFYSLVLCSPPIMLLVERCNVDIIIYSFLFLALILLKKPKRLIFRFLGHAVILWLALLKIFPLFALSVVIKEKRKYTLLIGGGLLSLFLVYYFSHLEELEAIRKMFVGGGDWVSFGYRNIFYRIKIFLHELNPIINMIIVGNDRNIFYRIKIFLHELNSIRPIIVFTLACFLSLIFSAKVLVYLWQQLKHWLSLHSLESSLNSLSNSKYIDGFRIGSSLYIGNFLIVGKVFDYKLAFWIFAMPQIISWIKSRDQMSFSSVFALLGILGSLYLSQFNEWGVDEIINWLLLGYLIYGFCRSLPEWLTKIIHNTLNKAKSGFIWG